MPLRDGIPSSIIQMWEDVVNAEKVDTELFYPGVRATLQEDSLYLWTPTYTPTSGAVPTRTYRIFAAEDKEHDEVLDIWYGGNHVHTAFFYRLPSGDYGVCRSCRSLTLGVVSNSPYESTTETICAIRNVHLPRMLRYCIESSIEEGENPVQHETWLRWRQKIADENLILSIIQRLTDVFYGFLKVPTQYASAEKPVREWFSYVYNAFPSRTAFVVAGAEKAFNEPPSPYPKRPILHLDLAMSPGGVPWLLARESKLMSPLYSFNLPGLPLNPSFPFAGPYRSIQILQTDFPQHFQMSFLSMLPTAYLHYLPEPAEGASVARLYVGCLDDFNPGLLIAKYGGGHSKTAREPGVSIHLSYRFETMPPHLLFRMRRGMDANEYWKGLPELVASILKSG